MDDALALGVLRSIAPQVVPTGGPGTSKAMSIVECLVAGVAMAASAEAVALAAAAGLDASDLVPLLLKGSGANAVLAARAGAALQADAQAVRTGLALACDLAREARHPSIFGALAVAGLRAADGETMSAAASRTAQRGGPSSVEAAA